MIPIRPTPQGLTFSIKVHPKAKKNAITGVLGSALKLSLTAPPVDGKANDAVLRFFAELFSVPRSAVTIVSGHSSRAKVVMIFGVSEQKVRDVLATSL